MDAAFRAYRMLFENVKECWTFMAMPLIMWVFAIFGGGLPHVTNDILSYAILTSGLLYCVGNYMFVRGYISSTESRMTGLLQSEAKIGGVLDACWIICSCGSGWAGLDWTGLVWCYLRRKNLSSAGRTVERKLVSLLQYALQVDVD